MEPDAVRPEPDPDPDPDLATLERIEGELFAVERALEQIDQGIYEGFEGLDPRESAASAGDLSS
jgi:hypothetical protein